MPNQPIPEPGSTEPPEGSPSAASQQELSPSATPVVREIDDERVKVELAEISSEDSQPQELEPKINRVIEKPDDRVRRLLANGLIIVVVSIIASVMGTIYVDKLLLYGSVEQWVISSDIELSEESPASPEAGISPEKFVEVWREHTQQSNALMTLLITTGFSALSGAIGFYFGSNRSSDSR
jgi:hypothetical protein